MNPILETKMIDHSEMTKKIVKFFESYLADSGSEATNDLMNEVAALSTGKHRTFSAFTEVFLLVATLADEMGLSKEEIVTSFDIALASSVLSKLAIAIPDPDITH